MDVSLPHTCVKVPVPVDRIMERPVPVPIEIDRPVDRVKERPVYVPVSTSTRRGLYTYR
jgi:hypothetical protein